MQHTHYSKIALGSLLALNGAASWAQTAATDTLEEVIVTAQRRSEKMQEVPISMSAISGAALENFGVKDFNDYALTIPNLAVSTGSGAGGNGSAFGVSSTRAVAIRGVAGNNTTSFYLNDTPVPLSLDPRAVDIDRVEVLRGPQGTLFGASSMGGTVRLVTREPSTEKFSAKVEAEGSHTNKGGGGYSADGTLNVPLMQGNIGLRMNAFSSFEPGLYTRTWGGPQDPRLAADSVLPYPPGGPPSVGSKKHVGSEQATGFSASLAITPQAIEGLSITPMFMYQHSKTNGYPLADFTPNDFVQTRQFDIGESVDDKWSFAGVTAKQDVKYGRFVASGTYFYRRATDIEDTSDINALYFWGIPYYVPAPLLNQLFTKTYTQEVRFESSFNGPVQFVLGYFHSHSDRRFFEIYDSPGLDAATGGALGTDLQYTQNTPNTDRQRAWFIDTTIKFSDKFQVSAGVRRAYLSHEGAYTADGPLNGGPSGPPDTWAKNGEHQNAPRFTAKYQFNPDHMLYASAAKGFRIGGTNSVVPAICDGDLANLGLKNGEAFKSDTLWSLELGSKNAFAGNRIRTRSAVYRIDWKGIQQTVFLPCTFIITANSGAAVSKGAEFEIDLAVIDHLTLNLGIGYEDARITQATTTSNTVVGQSLTGVPKWSGSASAQYVLPLGERDLFVRGQWEFTGDRKSYTNVAPADGGRDLPSFSTLNLRGGIQQGPWEATLYINNVFDKRGVMGDLLPEGAELAGRPKWFVTRPRTIGLILKREF
jgi:outer membrane receptor protein involved in Fe transport